MSTSSTEDETADQIRRKMANLRVNLGADINGVAAKAKDLTDWRQFVRRAPWMSVGLAAAAGFWAVPKKLKVEPVDPATIASLAKKHRVVVEDHPKTTGTGMSSALFGLISTTVLRAAVGFGSQKVAELMASPKADEVSDETPQEDETR